MEELKCLYSNQQIAERIDSLAEEISQWYNSQKEPVVLICILKGAFMFFADLVRRLNFSQQPEVDFIRIASYGNKDHSGEIVLSKDLETNIEDKHVLIVEDIIDTGNTLDFLIKKLKQRNPLSVKLCVLIDKKERKEKNIDVDFCGFEIEKGFVVGYGLDYAEKYRCLDGIYEVVFK